MSYLLLLVAATSLCNFSLTYAKSYDGYKVVRFQPKDEKQAKFLTSLVNDTEDADIRLWSSGLAEAGKPVDIMVSPSQYERVIKIAEQNKLETPKVMMTDLQK